MKEYNVALEKSLVDAELTANQAKDVISKAMEHQISYGLTTEKFVPKQGYPRRTGASQAVYFGSTYCKSYTRSLKLVVK